MTLHERMKLNPQGATVVREATTQHAFRMSKGSNGSNSVGLPCPLRDFDSHMAGGWSHDPRMVNLVTVLARDDWLR
jgi:hypothetical protein